MSARRNRFSFLVTWPDGHSYRVWYRTLGDADLAAEGFRMYGAAVTP